MILSILEIIFSFLLGSIPFGPLVCQMLGLAQPNSYGSKNIGASNVARQNKLAGLLTLILDAFKGFLALRLFGSSEILLFAVVLGHCYSPLMNYQGGKGVATYGGGLIALNPPLAATLSMLWILSFLKKKTPAISSLLISFVSIFYALLSQKHLLIPTALLIIIRHKNNVISKQQA